MRGGGGNCPAIQRHAPGENISSFRVCEMLFTSGRYDTEVINSAPIFFFFFHFVLSRARSRRSKSLRRRRQLPVNKCTSGKHRTKSVKIVDLKPEDVIILTYMFSWITILEYMLI